MKRIASFLSSLSIQRITAPCLCLMLVLICLFSFQKQLTPTSGIVSSRKLPIYCVNTESPKVAISFDAAWGNRDLAVHSGKVSCKNHILHDWGVGGILPG